MSYFKSCSVVESLGDRQGKIVTSKINQEVGFFCGVCFPAAAWPFGYFVAFGCFPCSGRFPQLSWGLCCCGTARRAKPASPSPADTAEPAGAAGPAACERGGSAASSLLHKRHSERPHQTSGFVPERRGTGTDKQEHAQGTGSCFSSLMADPLM